jgi:diaminopimelate decarboxylase
MLSAEAISVKNGKIKYRGHDLSKFQTPSFVFSKELVKKQYQILLQAFSGIVPTEIAYCAKTNADRGILKVLGAEGSSFMICSLAELKLVRKSVKKSGIIYVSPFLSKEEFLAVRKFAVERFVIESREQYEMIKENVGKKNMELLVRINTGTEANGLYPNSNTFGMKMDDAYEILEEAAKHKNISKIGLHNHMVTQNTSLGSWERALRVLVDFSKLLTLRGITIDYLNIGGGFPVEYGERLPGFDALVETISFGVDSLQNIFPGMQLIMEPGRFIVGPAGVLVTKVINVRDLVVTVDASVYNCSMDSIIVGLQLPVQTNARGEKVAQLIRGKTPDSLDVFRHEVLMPRVQEGDLIVFLQAGAYTFSSDFLHLPKPGVKLL